MSFETILAGSDCEDLDKSKLRRRLDRNIGIFNIIVYSTLQLAVTSAQPRESLFKKVVPRMLSWSW